MAAVSWSEIVRVNAFVSFGVGSVAHPSREQQVAALLRVGGSRSPCQRRRARDSPLPRRMRSNPFAGASSPRDMSLLEGEGGLASIRDGGWRTYISIAAAPAAVAQAAYSSYTAVDNAFSHYLVIHWCSARMLTLCSSLLYCYCCTCLFRSEDGKTVYTAVYSSYAASALMLNPVCLLPGYG